MDNLERYVRSKITDLFMWGTHDCLTFANGAVEAVTGGKVFEVWLSGYSTERAALLRYECFLRDSGYKNIIDAVDSKFDRLMTLHPPHGTLVARPVMGNVLGYAFGISINGNIALMSEDGIIRVVPDIADIYWSLG